MYHKPTDATREIKRRAQSTENICFSVHAEERMIERGIDHVDVLACLRRGLVREQPDLNSEYQDWNYRVELNRSNEAIVAVVALPEEDQSVIIVTAFTVVKRNDRKR